MNYRFPYKSGKVLENILDKFNDVKLSNKVGGIWHDYCIVIKDLKNVNHYFVAHRLSILFLNDFKSRLVNLPLNVRTHLINMATAKRRELEKSYEHTS